MSAVLGCCGLINPLLCEGSAGGVVSRHETYDPHRRYVGWVYPSSNLFISDTVEVTEIRHRSNRL